MVAIARKGWILVISGLTILSANYSIAIFLNTKPYFSEYFFYGFLILIFLTLILPFLWRYRRHISVFTKSLYNSEHTQTEALLESLNNMVNKLEVRDHVLVEEKNHAEEEKKRAESANKAKTNFLINMSHELRTPMHAILNFADIGKNSAATTEPEKIIFYFSRIEESGERLLRLIDGLLDLTRLESGKVNFKFANNDILECVDYTKGEITSLLEKKSINLNIQKNCENSQISFDKDHIIRVMINLISNAIKFSPEGSSINVILENGKYTFTTNKKAKGIKITVEDAGPGIAEDEKEIIFNKFIQGRLQSSKEMGSGLGLAISKEIIIAHGGRIWAENIPQGGAKISFVLPENLIR